MPVSSEYISYAVALIAVAGFTYAVIRWGRSIASKALRFLTHEPYVPKKTVKIMPKENENWWHMGSKGGEPAMHIVFRWNATNITDETVYILKTFITRPYTDGMVRVRHPERDIYMCGHPILPRATSEGTSDYWISPPIMKRKQDFRATVIVIDHFGNKHKIKNVFFRYR